MQPRRSSWSGWRGWLCLSRCREFWPQMDTDEHGCWGWGLGRAGTDMPSLDRKANDVFGGRVVRKDLVRKVKVGANVPVYVLEYLLGKYCATDDPAAIEAGLRLVNTTISDNCVRPDEANKAQFRLKDRGKASFIDKVRVRALEDKDWAELANFGHRFLNVSQDLIRKYPRLLEG